MEQSLPFQTRLANLLTQVYRQELAFVDSLTPDERDEAGSFERWSAKDVIAHNASWRGRFAEILAQADQLQESPADWDEPDTVNPQVYAQFHALPWPEVMALAERNFQALLAAVAPFSEDDLTSSQRYPWRGGRALLQAVMGNNVTHPLTHLSTYFMQHGDMPEAIRLQEQLVDNAAQLIDTPEMRGVNLYNLACFYALNHMTSSAVASLAEALRLRPDLRDYAPTDHDFDLIREDEGFKELM